MNFRKKSLLVGISLILCWVTATILAAQIQTTVIQSATIRSRFATWDGSSAQRASGGRQCVDLTGQGVQNHAVQFQTTGNPASVSISVTADTGNGTYSSVGSSTSTTSATISFSGTYKTVCVTATFSDGSSIDASYNGEIAVAAGDSTIVRVTPAMSGYTTQATFTTSGLWTIQNLTTNQATGTTTLLQSAVVTNITSSAVTFQIMDGNSKYLIGPTFSLPASSTMTINFPSGLLMTSGINISAGTANALTVEFWGLQ